MGPRCHNFLATNDEITLKGNQERIDNTVQQKEASNHYIH